MRKLRGGRQSSYKPPFQGIYPILPNHTARRCYSQRRLGLDHMLLRMIREEDRVSPLHGRPGSVRDGNRSGISAGASGAVAIVATLDTKGPEASFLSDIIQTCGRKTILIDIGTSNNEVKAAHATDASRARSASPAELLKEIAAATRIKVAGLLASGAISAIVAIAGGKEALFSARSCLICLTASPSCW